MNTLGLKNKLIAIVCVVLCMVYLLCGCSGSKQEIQAIYMGKPYVQVNNWFPSVNHYEKIIVSIDDCDCNAYLYSQNEKFIIKVDGDLAGEMYFLSENEKHPTYQQVDNVEKIIISEFSGQETTVDDRAEIKSWIDNINTAKNRSLNDEAIGSICIYYKDYPAYQYVGNIYKNKSGEYTFELN